jgi:hypothetical protein
MKGNKFLAINLIFFYHEGSMNAHTFHVRLQKISEERCPRYSVPALYRAYFGDCEKFQTDPNFNDFLLFYKYYHGDNGPGVEFLISPAGKNN